MTHPQEAVRVPSRIMESTCRQSSREFFQEGVRITSLTMNGQSEKSSALT